MKRWRLFAFLHAQEQSEEELVPSSLTMKG